MASSGVKSTSVPQFLFALAAAAVSTYYFYDLYLMTEVAVRRVRAVS